MKNNMMDQFPANPDKQVTLANWRTQPFSRWAFRHVREVVASANIAAGRCNEWVLDAAPLALMQVAFEGVDGGETTLGQWLGQTASDGFCVLQRGARVLEWYDAGHGPDQPHIVFSVSKSITAMLAGVVAERGVLDPDAPVTRYIPEADGSAYGDCTVRHVLDMTVGVDFDEDYVTSGETFLRYRQSTGWNPAPPGAELSDMRSFLVTLKRDGHAHGAAFHYVSPNSDMLGWIIERATGERLAQILSRRLWQPLGAESDGYVTVDRLGAARTAGGICITLRDMARLGEAMRCRGMANGKQVVPGWWVDDILTNGDKAAWNAGDLHRLFPGGRYRSMWYSTGADTGAFCAIGIHGQWIYVDPASEVVIAKQSSAGQPTNDAADLATLRAFAAICGHLGG